MEGDGKQTGCKYLWYLGPHKTLDLKSSGHPILMIESFNQFSFLAGNQLYEL